MSKMKKIEEEALKLSPGDRAKLGSRLLRSVEQESDIEIEAAWVEEAERRYQEALCDPTVTEPASAAIQRARIALSEKR